MLPANSAGPPHFLSQLPLHQPEQTFQTGPCGKAVGPSHHSQQTRWLHQRDDSEIKQRTFKSIRYLEYSKLYYSLGVNTAFRLWKDFARITLSTQDKMVQSATTQHQEEIKKLAKTEEERLGEEI